MIEVIILAGGYGRRLQNIVTNVPKPMAPINGKPFLEIILKRLSEQSVDRVILSLGFMADKIYSHFGKNFHGIDIDYSIEKNPLGTGGGIKLALKKCCSDHAIVLNGDTFFEINVQDLHSFWIKEKIPVLVGCDVNDTSRYGKLIISKENVIGFEEKGIFGKGLINAGCYVLFKNQFKDFPLESFSLENDFLSNFVKENKVALFRANGKFIDIGIPEDYLKAQKYLANFTK